MYNSNDIFIYDEYSTVLSYFGETLVMRLSFICVAHFVLPHCEI